MLWKRLLCVTQCQACKNSQLCRKYGGKTCEKMARASNPKKFSLVYQELGREARRLRDGAVLTEDLLDATTLSRSGEARTLLPVELDSDSLRSTEARLVSTDGRSSDGLPNIVEVIEKFLRPMALCARFSLRYLCKERGVGMSYYSSRGILRFGGRRAFIASCSSSAGSCKAMRGGLEYIAIFRLTWSASKRSCDYLKIYSIPIFMRTIIRGVPCVQPKRRSRLPNGRLQVNNHE